MATDTDLEALLPKLSSREAFAELEAARRADAEKTPLRTIIPEPEMPPLLPRGLSSIIRFPCALDCGWAHEHDAYAEDADPISVPLSASPEEISRIFSERAEQRSARLRAKVESAIRTHFTSAHPGQEPPEREVW
ncbi:hypothetical protein PV387_14675 [Streptomyces sp. ME02-6987-2C]|uniref:hypothetical protein n=1 Tax=unclassified Streptomyces TaxID=2593676 RepID=UPI0029A5AA51|nr:MULTISPECIES: hypothetical protein [unclassified Streptomyces]MDX3345861.1 hypothetical protein [Streptomyces sp. ME02-6979A]MDX3367264.1 hypothetical protein [Streptomyces sp. ME02-6987-2C]MDX3404889.1 hypothetical protein [Streptomyces sp. ME02-6977A]MDX3421627.1 hypothetical protein [Streptomyces sp. ME02-6985-2c]